MSLSFCLRVLSLMARKFFTNFFRIFRRASSLMWLYELSHRICVQIYSNTLFQLTMCSNSSLMSRRVFTLMLAALTLARILWMSGTI